LTIGAAIEDVSLNEALSPEKTDFPAIEERSRPQAWLYGPGFLMCGTDPDMVCSQFSFATNQFTPVKP